MSVRCLLVLVVLIMGWPASLSLAAQAKPMSVAEIALYKVKDREQILLDGAKKEGHVTFYTSNTWMAGYVSQEFGRKYPFIKTDVWRSDSKELLKRLTDEAAAGRFIGDVVETTLDRKHRVRRERPLVEVLSDLLQSILGVRAHGL